MPDLSCDGDGVYMVCRAANPAEVDLIACATCATPWHSPCLSKPPALADAATWACPDCSGDAAAPAPAPSLAAGAGGMLAAIRAIEADATLSDKDKARKRQELLGGAAQKKAADEEEEEGGGEDDSLQIALLKNFKCAICMNVPDRPVSICGEYMFSD